MKLIASIIFAIFLSCSSGDGKSGKINKQQLEKKSTIIKQKSDKKIFEKGDLSFEIISEISHGDDSYTQGYVLNNGFLYESSGGFGKSRLMKINPSNGEIINQEKLSLSIFAEGIELIGDKIYLLTWKSGLCNIYDLSFNLVSQFRYKGEGWGICSDGKEIFTSNGSNIIQKRDINSFSKTDEVAVFDYKNMPLDEINELEYAAGEIFANIWLEDKIIRIDPNTGDYLGEIDFSLLRTELQNNPNAEALNGIAYDETQKLFYITGKNWNKTFVVKFNNI